MPRVVDVDLGLGEEGGGTGPPEYFHGPFYQAMLGCTACPIRQEAQQVVPGVGPADAEVLILGQNPGDEENVDGRPFCGRSGKELDKWLDLLGLSRERVVVTNTVHCHTSGNREPRPAEAEVCRDLWLPQELAFLHRVSVIVTLGNVATRAVLGKGAASTGLLQLYWSTVQHADRQYTVYPLAHPSFVIRSPGNRERLYKEILPQLRGVLQTAHPEVYGRPDDAR